MRQGWSPARRVAGAPKSAAPARTPGGRTAARPGAGKGDGAARAGRKVGKPELIKRRDELARQFAELQWDLGGMAYEMANRDQYRLAVLNKQAEKLQEIDAQLGQIERVMKLDEAGAAGTCPSCGSLQARGAVFCWHCGKELKTGGKPKRTAKPKRAKPKSG